MALVGQDSDVFTLPNSKAEIALKLSDFCIRYRQDFVSVQEEEEQEQEEEKTK